MDSHKIAVKIFATSSAFTGEDFVPVFHRWIQNQVLAHHTLIDVVDYDHVPNGPIAVLVANEANIALDLTDGRLGLLYFRKRPIPGADTFADRLRAVLTDTLNAAERLQADEHFAGRLRFNRGDLQIRIHDRLEAPNAAATYQQLTPQIQAVVTDVLGPATLTPTQNPQSVFAVQAQAVATRASVV